MRLPVPRPSVSFRYLLVGGTVFVVIAGAAVGGIVWATSGGGTSRPSTAKGAAGATRHPTHLTHRQYALLYTDAVVHKTRISVLAQWPSPPYQHYTYDDQTCYEWWDKPVALYNLCFKNGVVSTKAIE